MAAGVAETSPDPLSRSGPPIESSDSRKRIAPRKRIAKTVAFTLLGLVSLVLVLLVAGIIVIQTAWFKNRVRTQLEAVIERATGGRVEIGSFSYNWRTLTAEVAPFTLHGTEPASAPPLFHADKIQIRFKIISALEKKVDISSLVFDTPRLYITIDPAGSSNIPRPKLARLNQDVIADLIDLHVRHIEVHHGMAAYNTWRVPLDATGEQLQMSLRYDASGPRYLCVVSSARMRVASSRLSIPAAFSLDSEFSLAKDAIQITRVNLASGATRIESAGTIVNLFSPRLDFEVTAAIPVEDLNKVVRTPLEPRGDLSFQGRITAGGSDTDRFIGKVAGHSLAWAQKGVEIRNVALSSEADFIPDKFNLTNLQISSPDGSFRGATQIAVAQGISLKGSIDGVTIAEIGRLTGRQTGALSGTLSGPIELNGQFTPSGIAGARLNATLDLKPAAQGVPVSGSLAINYDQRAQKIQLGDSQLNVGSTTAMISGTLGQNLAVHLTSKNLNDAIPILRAFGAAPPAQWPIELQSSALQSSTARIDASVTGPLANPKISGKFDAGKLKLGGQSLDHVASTFTADQNTLLLQSLIVEQGKMRAEGNGRAELRNWVLEGASPVSATLALRNADIPTLAAETGFKTPPATGSVSATVRVSGSLESPLVAGTLTADDLTVYGEHFDQARADVTWTTTASRSRMARRAAAQDA